MGTLKKHEKGLWKKTPEKLELAVGKAHRDLKKKKKRKKD